MLLSHNFAVSPEQVPVLGRDAFAEVFRQGLSVHPHVHCRPVDHPHWMVEIRFSTADVSPWQVGAWCAEAIVAKRQTQAIAPEALPDVLVLGGLKTTPPTSDAPGALQPGEWGVDVVETESGDGFLQGIAWETTIAQRPSESVFQVALRPRIG